MIAGDGFTQSLEDRLGRLAADRPYAFGAVVASLIEHLGLPFHVVACVLDDADALNAGEVVRQIGDEK